MTEQDVVIVAGVMGVAGMGIAAVAAVGLRVWMAGVRHGTERTITELGATFNKRAEQRTREQVPLVGWIAVMGPPPHEPETQEDAPPPKVEASVHEAVEAVVKEQQVRVLEAMWRREAKGEL